MLTLLVGGIALSWYLSSSVEETSPGQTPSTTGLDSRKDDTGLPFKPDDTQQPEPEEPPNPEFADPAGAFKITFPSGPPYRQSSAAIIAEKLGFGDYLGEDLTEEEVEQWKRWASEHFKDLDGYAWHTTSRGRRYRVLVIGLETGPYAGMSGNVLLDKHIDSYQLLGVKNVSSQRFEFDGGDCVQVEWRRPDGRAQVDRAVVAGRSLIILSVTATEPARVGVNRVHATDPPVKAFFESFKPGFPLIPPRVR